MSDAPDDEMLQGDDGTKPKKRIPTWVTATTTAVIVAIAVALVPTLLDALNHASRSATARHADPAHPVKVAEAISMSSSFTYVKADPAMTQLEHSTILGGKTPDGWEPVSTREDSWYVSNPSDDTITVLSISATDIRILPAPAGVVAEFQGGGGGGDPVYDFKVDLRNGDVTDKEYFRQRTIAIGPNEHAAFYFESKAPATHSYSWVFKLTVRIADGDPLVVFAGAGGDLYATESAVPAPDRFQVSALAPSYRVTYQYDDSSGTMHRTQK